MVRTRCPSISKFRLGFSFHLLVQVALALVGDILWASSSVTVVLFLAFV